MKRNSRFLTVALISALSLGAGVALAQQGQQQTPMMGYGMGQGMMGHMGMGMMGHGNMGMMGPGMQGMMGPGMMMDFGPMMEGRLAYVKAELGVTEAQTAAWDGYVKRSQSPSNDHAGYAHRDGAGHAGGKRA